MRAAFSRYRINFHLPGQTNQQTGYSHNTTTLEYAQSGMFVSKDQIPPNKFRGWSTISCSASHYFQVVRFHTFTFVFTSNRDNNHHKLSPRFGSNHIVYYPSDPNLQTNRNSKRKPGALGLGSSDCQVLHVTRQMELTSR